jgi:excisionase family DNA binding protein
MPASGHELKTQERRRQLAENQLAQQIQLVAAPEAARLLSVSEHTVRLWCYSSKLKSLKLGNRLLIRLRDLDEFISASERRSDKPEQA